MASLSAVNPHTGSDENLLGTGLGPQLQGALVDPIGQRLLYMDARADPARTPTFTFFGNPNFSSSRTAGSTQSYTPATPGIALIFSRRLGAPSSVLWGLA